MKVYNLKIIPGFFCILAVLAAAVFAACENPWMKEAVAPLYKNKDGGDNNDGGGGWGPAPVPTLYSIGEAAAYLAAAAGGTSAADSVPLTVALDLSGAEWQALLGVIADAGKTVQLNLSACTPSGSSGCLYTSGPNVTFNPGPDDSDPDRIAAKGLITSLVLPNAATRIPLNFPESTFYNFSALAGVVGANVDLVDNNAFRNCDALKTVNLPRGIGIGISAFYSCDALTTVNLPAGTIGDYAFADCDALTAVNLSAATSIGDYAFQNCDVLTTVNLPSAVSIGAEAFSQCTSLESVSLPATPPALGTSVFANTGPSGTLTIHVPVGAVGNYTPATPPGWNVSNDTAANGNTLVYGTNHKAIRITDL
jgi:hypothetical protein